jgi:hypothetical protein
VLLLGKNKIGVGVWLYESCFTTTVQDDMSVIAKYVMEGVNNLSVIDIDDAFAHRNASYTTSEAHFSAALARGEFEVCLDIKRCRIGGVFPVPIKVKTTAGYELLSAEKSSYDQKPQQLIDAEKYALGKTATKDQNWQRRLLDLSMKNNLLAFRYTRDSLHIVSADLTAFVEKLADINTYTLAPALSVTESPVYFGTTKQQKNLGELIGIELSAGTMRTYHNENTLSELANTLIRKAKSAAEEVGANTLYLAFGFLKWKRRDEKEEKYAPLVLMPVTLKRTKTAGVTMEVGDDFVVNTTLLEFLKQEFGMDIRGVEDKGLSPAEILAVFRSKTANVKDWEVFEDIYLAQFTFARYAMWRDVRDNMPLYKQNSLIASLLDNTNRLDGNALKGIKEDDSNPQEVLTPLSCDSSQYEAIAESAKGTTFVLHGPPGTGKSQTITNIIANALAHGKRVLFVAEKQAALQVVQKRLNEIGIGEFCMELYSGKATDKGQLVNAIENTLSLKATYDSERFTTVADRITETRTNLKKPLEALHKKRRLGVSVYEGILYYLQNKNAPELVNIESTFYDSLTARKLTECENMLMTAQAAAKECGGVHRSPFDNINLTTCDDKTKNAVLCSAQVVLAELKHLKNYLGLLLDTFNQKISTFTYAKLEKLIAVIATLKDNTLAQFFACDEEQFYKFFNANLRYDAEVKHWLTRFKTLPDIAKFAPYMESEIENWGENYRSSKILLAVIKRINKCAKEDIPEKDEMEWMKRAYEMEQAKQRIIANTNLCTNFLALGGNFNDRKRDDFLRPLYDLHEKCRTVFMDYNADAFNSVCITANDGWLMPLLNGFVSSANAFMKSCQNFCKLTKADVSQIIDEDVLEYYSAKCTALIDNIDMLPAWCMYKATAKKLNDSGLTFITDAMESGRISGEQILASFRKNV